MPFPGKNDLHHVMTAHLLLLDKDLVSGQLAPTHFDKGHLLLSYSKLMHTYPSLKLESSFCTWLNSVEDEFGGPLMCSPSYFL